MDDYNTANHDFTMRHALQDLKTNPSSSSTKQNNSNSKLEHLWNTATSPANTMRNKEINKSRSEPNIQSNAVLQATQSFAKFQSITNLNSNNISKDNSKDKEETQEYDDETAKTIVYEFVTRFPSFKSKLAEQFPEEWLNISHEEHTNKPDPHQLFQFSQLERTEKERIIQEIFEYGPAQK